MNKNTDNTISVAARHIPVLADVDVLVCGGGPAGCAAVLAARGEGAEVLLVEKNGYLGGATVSQLVSVVLSTNGLDFQGSWHRWARELRRVDGIAPMRYSNNPLYEGLHWLRTSVDPEKVKIVWDQLLGEAGARVLHFATVTDVLREGDEVFGVVVLTRAGLRAIRARCVIDATGDGLVSHLAGADWGRGVSKRPWPQAVSLVYRVGGTRGKSNPGNPGTLAGLPERKSREDMLRVDPLDPGSVSDAMRRLRTKVHEQKLTGREYIASTAPELGVRTSRIISGEKTVSDEDAWNLRKRNDGVARSSWELDVHPPDEREPGPRMYHSRSDMYRERAKHVETGDWFDIPYGALVARGVANLLMAGRIASAGYLAQGSLRIQQTCMSTGEAAGLAGAMSVQESVAPSELDAQTVRDTLRDYRDVEPALGNFEAMSRSIRCLHRHRADGGLVTASAHVVANHFDPRGRPGGAKP